MDVLETIYAGAITQVMIVRSDGTLGIVDVINDDEGWDVVTM